MWKSAAVPRLCEFYSGICLISEEKVRKNLSQGKKNLSQIKKNLSQSRVYMLRKHPHITKPTHTHAHITKQYKTTTVQIETKCIQQKQHNRKTKQHLVSNVVNPH
jgi:hypothetical protein